MSCHGVIGGRKPKKARKQQPADDEYMPNPAAAGSVCASSIGGSEAEASVMATVSAKIRRTYEPACLKRRPWRFQLECDSLSQRHSRTMALRKYAASPGEHAHAEEQHVAALCAEEEDAPGLVKVSGGH